MDTMQNAKNLTLNFSKNSIKQSITARILKTQAQVELLFKKKELNVFENRLSIMNKSAGILDSATINLEAGFNRIRSRRFNECLNSMEPLQKKAFYMKTIEKHKIEFICDHLQISEDLFWSLINKSRKELITALELY